MVDVIITRGTYGHRVGSRVRPVSVGETVSLPDAEAERLVLLGVASRADASVPAAEPETAVLPDKELSRMNKAELEQLAKDLGVDLTGAKSNRERVELIQMAPVLGSDIVE